MRHLFCDEGDRALQAVMKQRPLLAFDFDGTLAPIVARPDEAKVPH
jgi:trehalose 6-phosphate phosphatase